jgi:predicted GNAT superfamily acetyltransferase
MKTSYTALPYLSVTGGVVAAALVFVFAWRGGLHATRFVLIGFVFGITGPRDGRLIHLSDMLGIRKAYRGRGIGYRLDTANGG